MKNHFHFEVQIKEDIIYQYSQIAGGVYDNRALKILGQQQIADFNSLKWQTLMISDTKQDSKNLKTPSSSRHFSHLFSTYTKYINAKYNRHGNLFERPFHRKKLKTDEYLFNVFIYIHNNPIHHGFVKNLTEWQWCSYANYLSPNPTKFQEGIIGNWFNDIDNFKYIHNNWVDNSDMDEYLGL
jgi:REP element-mobilizing transposase RayT